MGESKREKPDVIGLLRYGPLMPRLIKLIEVYLCRQPVVTGTSVLGVVFDGGVALAADVLGESILPLQEKVPWPPPCG